jgi:hypothetical protein
MALMDAHDFPELFAKGAHTHAAPRPPFDGGRLRAPVESGWRGAPRAARAARRAAPLPGRCAALPAPTPRAVAPAPPLPGDLPALEAEHGRVSALAASLAASAPAAEATPRAAADAGGAALAELLALRRQRLAALTAEAQRLEGRIREEQAAAAAATAAGGGGSPGGAGAAAGEARAGHTPEPAGGSPSAAEL